MCAGMLCHPIDDALAFPTVISLSALVIDTIDASEAQAVSWIFLQR